MPPETKYERGIIYDMRCLLESGEEVIVEMQNRGQDYFRDRICYYMARAISSQGDRGKEEWKFDIHPVYGVFFMNFHLRENEQTSGSQTDIRHIALMDVDNKKMFSDKLQFWLLELPRYRKMAEADCKTNKDYWLYTITHLETMNAAVPFQAQKPIFHKLENVADMAQLTREEREFYHVSLDSFRTNLAVMDHERNEGRAEGRAEGLAEGRAEGLAEGRAEERKQMALNMKEMGLSNEIIVKATGLTLSDVENL